ncbi:MAG TPA: hypothetical protein VJJ23_00530 [Candidatus Nanoarchaeia archaeon]|nr:hypothetical protein [Candidatus Nanoarchaeia archaeon]
MLVKTRKLVILLIFLVLFSDIALAEKNYTSYIGTEPKPLYGGDNPEDADNLEFDTEEWESFYTQGANNWYYTKTSRRGPLKFGIKDITNGDDLDIYVYDYQANDLLCKSTKSGNANDECPVQKDNDALWGFYINIIPYKIDGSYASGYVYTKAHECTEEWLDGKECRSGNTVYRDWQNKDCSIERKYYEDCDDKDYEEDWGSPYCSGNNVMESRTLHDYYCGGKGECRDSSSTEKRVKEYCDSDEKCSNNACIKKTCSDFPDTYGSCSNENEKRRTGDDVQKCEDQIFGSGKVLCWKKISQKGNDDFCSVLFDTGNKCRYNDYDCDPLECTNGLQCESKGGLSGFGVEGGCCYSGEKWNEDLNICYTPCILNSVSWDKTSAIENELIGISVNATSGCSGKQVNFEVKEDDCSLLSPSINNNTEENKDSSNIQSVNEDSGSKKENTKIGVQGICEDDVNINPSSAAFDSNGNAKTSWVAEYQDDIFGNPEYNVYAYYDNQKVKSSSELTVTPDWKCTQDSQCSGEGLNGVQYCLNGNVNQDFEAGVCVNHECGTETYPVPIEICEHGCVNGECIKEYCGDNICRENENYDVCPNDCKKPEFCGDNICQVNEDYNSCPNDCKKPCTIPDGSSLECSCSSDAQCKNYGDYYCDKSVNFGTCKVIVYSDECVNHDNYLCEDGNVKKCVFNGKYWVKQRIQQCSGKYQYCDSNNVNAKQSCSVYENKFDVWLDYADTSVTVNKQIGDILLLNIYSLQDTSVNIDYNNDVFDGDCFGSFNVKNGVNTCKLEVKNDNIGLHKIKVNEKFLDVNVINYPEFLILTDSEKLFERFPDEENGVKAVLKQAYANAKDKGLVYDLSYYDLGAKNPFIKIKNYFEKITKPNVVDNSYSLDVADFIKEKCKNCKDVLILGDDFVVPHYRRDIPTLRREWFFWTEESIENVYTDVPYIKKTSLEFSDYYEMFKINGKYEGKDVLLILPDDITTEQRTEVEKLKKSFVDKGYNPDYSEMNGKDAYCVDERWFTNVKGKTLIIIGTEEDNNAFKCMPFVSGDTNRDSAFMQPNVWDTDEFALVINTDNPEIIGVLANLVETGEITELKSESAYFFKVGATYASYAVLGVGIGSMIVFSGGTATPAAMVTAGIALDWIADAGDVADTCVVNSESVGWCGGTIALAAMPYVPSKPAKKVIKGLADSNLNNKLKDLLEPVKDLINKHFRKLRSSQAIGDEAFEAVTKTAHDNIYMAKGAEKVIGNDIDQIDSVIAKKIKFDPELNRNIKIKQLQAATYIKSVGKIQDGLDDMGDLLKKQEFKNKFDNMVNKVESPNLKNSKGARGEIESLAYEDLNEIDDFDLKIKNSDVGEIINPNQEFAQIDILRENGDIIETKFGLWDNLYVGVRDQTDRYIKVQSKKGKEIGSIIFRQKLDEIVQNKDEALRIVPQDVIAKIKEKRAIKSQIFLELIDVRGNLWRIDIA